MRPLLAVLISIQLSVSVLLSEHSNLVSVHVDFSQLEDDIITKNVHKSVGDDVILKCKRREHLRAHTFRWKFAKCARCEDVRPTALQWTDVDDGNRKLRIRNATIGDSGRYICVANGIRASYNLQVSADDDGHRRRQHNVKFQGRPPEIVNIDIKSDLIAAVLVKCTVSSPITPLFHWLKQCDDETTTACDFKYADKYYSRLKVRTQNVMRTVDGDYYISKLRIDNFTTSDNGVYVCFAMSMLGKDYRHFTLAVADGSSDAQLRLVNGSTHLHLLFLVPVVFILVPICIDCLAKRICANLTKPTTTSSL